MKKKLMSILTATAMTLSAMPFTVSAVENKMTITVPVVHEKTGKHIDGVSLHLYQQSTKDEELQEIASWNTSDVNPLVIEDMEYNPHTTYWVSVDDVPYDYATNSYGGKTHTSKYYAFYDSDDNLQSDFYVCLYDDPHIEYPVSSSLDIFVDAENSNTGEFIADVGYKVAVFDYETGEIIEELAKGKTGNSEILSTTYKYTINSYSDKYSIGLFITDIPKGYVFLPSVNDRNNNLAHSITIGTNAYVDNYDKTYLSAAFLTESEAQTTTTTPQYELTQTRTTTTYLTTTTTAVNTETGDANCDGNVNMADAVLIMQSLSNPDKYGVNGTDETHITAQGEKNGDMDDNGLTNADALGIQKILLKLNDTPEQISPIQPPTVQSIHFENISSLAKEINDYDLDKYSEISREGYRKMYDTIKNDGSIYEVKVNETVNIDLERGIAVVPNAKYEDLGIYSYTKNDFQIIVYYIDKGSEHNGIADYFTKRFSQNILKEISVNGKETVISEFGITDDTRRICASAFIDDSHYYTVRSCVGGTEEELTAFLNNITFVNVPIA